MEKQVKVMTNTQLIFNFNKIKHNKIMNLIITQVKWSKSVRYQNPNRNLKILVKLIIIIMSDLIL